MATFNSINSNLPGNNTFLGASSGKALTSGIENVGMGFDSLTDITSGSNNVTLGNITGTAITTGSQNTILGSGSGAFLGTGSNNVLIGYLNGSNYTTVESRNLIIGTGYSGTALDTNKYFIGFIDGVNPNVSFAHNIGNANTFFGENAGNTGLTIGVANLNTGFGYEALKGLTVGTENTCVGVQSGLLISTGQYNTAIGYGSLHQGTAGLFNICVGYESGNAFLTNESSNICIGHQGVVATSNTIWIGTDGVNPGQQDTCNIAGLVSVAQGLSATTGDITATAGNLALPNTNGAGTEGEITFGGNRFISNFGNLNTFVGENSGNTTHISATENVALGTSALPDITTASGNTAIGAGSCLALVTGTNNTAVGATALNALLDGTLNIAIGASAGSTYVAAESTNICIGNDGIIGDNNAIRIGTAGIHTTSFMAGVVSTPPATPDAQVMIIDSLGQMGTLGAMTDGQLVIGSTGTTPVLGSLTAGTNITITPGAGTITIDAAGGGSSFPITLVSGAVAMDSNNGYRVAFNTTANFTLPATAAAGEIIAIYLENDGNYATNNPLLNLAQGAGQQIFYGGTPSTAGVGHGFSSTTSFGGAVILRCIVADTVWFVNSNSIQSAGVY